MVIAWKLQARLTALEIGELLREALFQRFAQQSTIAGGMVRGGGFEPPTPTVSR
jgi:hypothetical protein